MEAKKKEIMQMVNECNNERFISFLCSMIKAFSTADDFTALRITP